MKRPWVKLLLGLAGLLVLIGICLRVTAAPTRELPDREWFFRERQKPTTTDLQIDPDIERMIKCAQRDYFIAPSLSGSRVLHFGHAWNVEPNDVYLAFGNGEPDLLIVYRCTREKGKLLWKAVEYQNP